MYQRLKIGVLMRSIQFHNIRSLKISPDVTLSKKWLVFYLIFPIRFKANRICFLSKGRLGACSPPSHQALSRPIKLDPLRRSVNTHYYLSHGIQAYKYLVSSGGLIGPHSEDNALSGNLTSILKIIATNNKLLKWLTAWDQHHMCVCSLQVKCVNS